ncbi:MAG: hypothetical protein LBE31_05165 [Deltaproteobacteria bacterium]|jgi:hypothetical protein|nr:hypothetical protein [Deltaproteobacteria bacterium]
MLRKFWQDTTASLGAAFALSLPALFALTLAVTQTTSVVGFQTRLHQSDAAANIFLAKQERLLSEEDKQKLIDAWMDTNMEPTGGEKIVNKEIDPVTQEERVVSVQYKPKNFAGDIIGDIFDEYVPLEVVTTERFRYPLEVVIVLDVSSSAFGFSPFAAVIDGAFNGINNVFGDDTISNDTRVSLLAYNLNVTFSAKHARNLVKPSSRMLYRGTTQAEFEAYEKRKAWMAEWGLGEDLLAPGAPGTEVDFFALLRKPLKRGTTTFQRQMGTTMTPAGGAASDADIEYYAEHADDPIENLERDGFELAVIDGRNYNPDIYGSDYTKILGKGNWSTTVMVNRDRCIKSGCPRDPDLYKYILVPKEKVNEEYRTRINPDSFTVVTNYFNALPNDEFIAACGVGSAIMPILAGSNDKNEVLNHMKYYNKSLTRMQMTTGPDEGLIWAYRLLSPNYSKIWEVSEDYPAPYHSTTEKRVIFYAGFPSAGYSTSGDARVLKALCDQMILDGIELYMLGESTDFSGVHGAAFKACVQPEKYPDRVLQYANAATATAAWTKAFERQYHVRLKNSN